MKVYFAKKKKISQEKNDWKKMFATHVLDKELTSLICEELSEIEKKMINHTIEKWEKDRNRERT